jgi:hypothetical protein
VRIERNRRFPWLLNKVDLYDPVYRHLAAVFRALDGDDAALRRKRPQSLRPDFFLPDQNCILEFDELQHFTPFRGKSLLYYPLDVPLGFDLARYQAHCADHADRATGKGAAGYRKPKAEFPFEGGRHAQRAFFDAYRDLLPALHELAPTRRIAEFDIPALGSSDEGAARDQVARALKLF